MNYDASSILQLVGWIVVITAGLTALLVIIRRSESPSVLASKLGMTALVIAGEVWFVHRTIRHLRESINGMENLVPAFEIVISVALCAAILAPFWTPHICNLVLNPITNLFDGGNLPPEKKPLYSMAIGRRKAGHPLEAMVELRRQLAAFPNDPEGVFLLAAVQAEDLMDLPGAAITLNQFCDSAMASPKQISAAMTQLADWHLRLGQDAESACAAWQQIIDRFPGTDLAQQAENRIAHAVKTQKYIVESKDRETVELREGVKDLGLQSTPTFQAPQERPAAERAAEYVKHLEQFPADAEARESLAMIYADEFNRLDMATMELRELIEGQNHTAKQTVRWLNLLATLQIKLGAEEATVRSTIKEITTRFPKTTFAEIAARRIGQLGNELRLQKQTPSKKLGVYESDMGLKRKLAD